MASSDDAILLQVPAKLNAMEASGLKTRLADRRGRPVALDFSLVTQIGSQCLQVLIAATRAWQTDDVSFEIKKSSDDIRDSLQICGLHPSLVGAKEVQNDA